LKFDASWRPHNPIKQEYRCRKDDYYG